jgi:acyl phosphate:glycerol-3-phosphate acyltransferase
MSHVMFWTLLGFLAGSIPFSILVGRIFLKTDIRTFGDGNPGGTNAWKAGGWRTGLLAVILDMVKGYLPVMLARHDGISGWGMMPIAIAPILGHAFSPFLNFRGGKALGSTGGVWIALIGLKALGIYILLTLPVLALQDEDAVAANAGLLSLLGYEVLLERSPSLTLFAILNILVVGWKHRKELFHPIQLRPWMVGLFGRKSA